MRNRIRMFRRRREMEIVILRRLKFWLSMTRSICLQRLLQRLRRIRR
ncbi:hypothetical protein Pint_27330 [Pistacia integerrima]|uniref:Uncharacterized protein n=1 Tax=Pistacia integerrima TaxID=434235 RepID=A0ACC0YN92_9ROSI|nr:hypothetical protein Pint_27330 [Pistacia integerrima]